MVEDLVVKHMTAAAYLHYLGSESTHARPVQGKLPDTEQGNQPDSGKGKSPESFPDITPETTTDTVVAAGATTELTSPDDKDQTLKQEFIGGTIQSAFAKFQQSEQEDASGASSLVAYLQSQPTLRSMLTKNQIAKLTKIFRFDGSPYIEDAMPSPSTLFRTMPLFREYVNTRIKWTKQTNHEILPPNVLVDLIASYDRLTPGREGWLLWKKLRADAAGVKPEPTPRISTEEFERQSKDADRGK